MKQVIPYDDVLFYTQRKSPEEMCRKVCRSVQQRLHVCMNNGGQFVSD